VRTYRSRRPYSRTYTYLGPIVHVPCWFSSGCVTPAFVFLCSGEVPCDRLTISQEDLITCIKHLLSRGEIINQTDNRICMKMAVTMRLDCGFFSFAHCTHSLCIETSHLLTIRVQTLRMIHPGLIIVKRDGLSQTTSTHALVEINFTYNIQTHNLGIYN